jgi:tetratricopeptide (TPR) repeat protein
MKKRFYLWVFVFASCGVKPTYYQTQKKVMDAYYSHQYGSALAAIEKNEYLGKGFNEDLYRVEKGKLLYNDRRYQEASKLLIAASVNTEDWSTFYVRNLMGDKVYLHKNSGPVYNPFHPGDTSRVIGQWSSTGHETMPDFKSPNKTKYVNSYFERPFVSYYIGLCGLQIDENMTYVEARRLNLLYDRINTRKSPFTDTVFSPDPFMQLCAGLFYEATGNLNEAFIAYEQSLKDFENPNCEQNYGLSTPQQLKRDLITISGQLDFEDRHKEYKKRFDQATLDTNTSKAGILFLVDVNHSPRRQLEVLKMVDSNKVFPEKYNYPYIEKVSEPITELSIEVENKQFDAAMISNMQYMLLDVCGKSIRNDFEKVNLNSINARHTNYDTRNWQTLPAQVFYSRVPIQQGAPVKVTLKYKISSEWKTKSIEIPDPGSKRLVQIQLDAD